MMATDQCDCVLKQVYLFSSTWERQRELQSSSCWFTCQAPAEQGWEPGTLVTLPRTAGAPSSVLAPAVFQMQE